MAAVLLEVALDVAKQRDVADGRDDEHEKGNGEYKDGEGDRHRESRGDQVTVEVLGNVIPFDFVLLRQVEGIQR